MRVLVTALLAAVLAGCTSSGLNPKVPNFQWSLVRMDLDVRYLDNQGTLPTWSKPSGLDFGMVPQASGYLQTTAGGKIACQVVIQEPVINYNGRSDLLEYRLVDFFGIRSEDGKKLILPDESSRSAPLGVATVFHVEDLGHGQLRLQGATGDKMLPYIYYFDAAPTRPGLISVPVRP